MLEGIQNLRLDNKEHFFKRIYSFSYNQPVKDAKLLLPNVRYIQTLMDSTCVCDDFNNYFVCLKRAKKLKVLKLSLFYGRWQCVSSTLAQIKSIENLYLSSNYGFGCADTLNTTEPIFDKLSGMDFDCCISGIDAVFDTLVRMHVLRLLNININLDADAKPDILSPFSELR